MARMSVDDMIQRDPRITKLANLMGWSRRETVGCLVGEIWPICYDQREHTIAIDLVDIAAGKDGFSVAMVDAGLAEMVRGGRRLRIRGAQERIEYLDRKREAGRVGGIRSAKSRQKIPSTESSSAQAHGNPPSPVPSPASVPVPPPAKKIRDSAQRHALAEGWVPDRSEANLAAESVGKQRGVDLRVELQSMRDWAKGENAKKADWDATWRNWVRRAKPRNAQGTQTTMPQVAIRKVPQL